MAEFLIPLAFIAMLFAGGGNKAIATSNQVANISANTTVNVNEQCSANQNVNIDSVNVVTGNITCKGPIQIGVVGAYQNATCTNKQNITVIAKVVSDQISKITSQTRAGVLNSATANSNTFVDVQNNLAVSMTARCNNSQKVTVGQQVYQIGNITSDSSCDILVSSFSQNSACIQDLLAQIENTNEVSQTTEVAASAGGDMTQFLIFMFLLLLIVGVVMIGGPLASSALTGDAAASGGGSGLDFFKSDDSESVTIPELRAQLHQLQSQAAAQGLVVAK